MLFRSTLIPCGLLLALVLLPLKGLSLAGYTIQGQWPHGAPGLEDPLLPVLVFCGTLTLLALAWGPLAAGRGSGALAVEALVAAMPATLNSIWINSTRICYGL